jgi:ADP-ribose pyrophosphatase YjhB (NUDIX family)
VQSQQEKQPVDDKDQRWLHWAREIQALAQTSLHYAQNPFEEARAQRLLEIAAEIVDHHSELGATDALIAFQAQPGYVTPKVDVRAAVFHENRLLFVREAMDGRWTFPGGWADVGEAPALAIEREVAEEAGLTVSAQKIVGIYDANRIKDAMLLFHAYKILFLCELEAGELSTSVETSESRFFALDDLPKRLSGYRTTPRHIEDAIAMYHEPSLPVRFD